MRKEGCAHCAGKDEDRLWSGNGQRIVLVHDTGFEGWCRVIWDDHISELTDLPKAQRQQVLDAVMALEEALRAELTPWKINIAALGTGAPHLHFHVIPRFEGDPTFPDPVWLPQVRNSERQLPEGFAARMTARLEQALGATAA